jgi:SET domain-containing protein
VKKLPHRNCYTRLRPSKIHGVGVFAIRRIKKGTPIFPDDEQSIKWVKGKRLRNLSPDVRKLYDDFCIIKKGGKKFGCPRSFNQMTVAWYLNEPRVNQRPNVECRDDYTFYALRDIGVGEELTVDYSTFSEKPATR